MSFFDDFIRDTPTAPAAPSTPMETHPSRGGLFTAGESAFTAQITPRGQTPGGTASRTVRRHGYSAIRPKTAADTLTIRESIVSGMGDTVGARPGIKFGKHLAIFQTPQTSTYRTPAEGRFTVSPPEMAVTKPEAAGRIFDASVRNLQETYRKAVKTIYNIKGSSISDISAASERVNQALGQSLVDYRVNAATQPRTIAQKEFVRAITGVRRELSQITMASKGLPDNPGPEHQNRLKVLKNNLNTFIEKGRILPKQMGAGLKPGIKETAGRVNTGTGLRDPPIYTAIDERPQYVITQQEERAMAWQKYKSELTTLTQEEVVAKQAGRDRLTNARTQEALRHRQALKRELPLPKTNGRVFNTTAAPNTTKTVATVPYDHILSPEAVEMIKTSSIEHRITMSRESIEKFLTSPFESEMKFNQKKAMLADYLKQINIEAPGSPAHSLQKSLARVIDKVRWDPVTTKGGAVSATSSVSSMSREGGVVIIDGSMEPNAASSKGGIRSSAAVSRTSGVRPMSDLTSDLTMSTTASGTGGPAPKVSFWNTGAGMITAGAAIMVGSSVGSALSSHQAQWEEHEDLVENEKIRRQNMGYAFDTREATYEHGEL